MEEGKGGWRKKSNRTRNRRFFFYYPLSFIIPSPPILLFRPNGEARKMSPFHGSFSSCDSPLVRYTHTHTHISYREKDGGEGEDPLTTRFVSQCNQASGNLWWMIYQKEFTAFLFFSLFLFFSHFSFFLMIIIKTNYKNVVVIPWLFCSFLLSQSLTAWIAKFSQVWHHYTLGASIFLLTRRFDKRRTKPRKEEH